jgi:hypothetical protein
MCAIEADFVAIFPSKWLFVGKAIHGTLQEFSYCF